MPAVNPFDEALKKAMAGGSATGAVPAPVATKQPSSPNLGSPSPVNTTMPVGDPNTAVGMPPPPLATPSIAAPLPIGDRKRDQWSGTNDVNERGDFGRLTGFNEQSFDPGSGEESLKNQFGRIASRFDPAQPGAIQMLVSDPEFAANYPNAKVVDGDKIDFGDGFPVDVLRNYVEGGGGDAWAWQTSNPADMGGGGAAPDAGGGGGAQLPTQGLGQPNNIAQIMAEIQSLSDGTESPNQRKAILDLLMEPGMSESI